MNVFISIHMKPENHLSQFPHNESIRFIYNHQNQINGTSTFMFKEIFVFVFMLIIFDLYLYLR